MLYLKIKQTVVVALLLAGVIFCASGHIEKVASVMGADSIAGYNEKYLEDSFDKSLKGFLILSGIKSGLAIIEGSEIGVGFNLEIGDIVQSVYDYVDIAWKAALTGGTIILMTQLVLQVVSMMNHWCLSFLFAFILCLYLFHLFSKTESPVVRLVKNAILFLSIFTIALYLILPISIRSAAFLSANITNPLIEEAQTGFLSVKTELSAEALSKRVFPVEDSLNESWMEKLNLNAQYQKTKANMAKLGSYLTIQAEYIAVWTIKLIAGYLFDCLLFPIIFFSFLYIFIKFTIHNLLGMRLVGGTQRAEKSDAGNVFV